MLCMQYTMIMSILYIQNLYKMNMISNFTKYLYEMASKFYGFIDDSVNSL